MTTRKVNVTRRDQQYEEEDSDWSNKGITSLKDLKFPRNLEKLDLGDNQISSLDEAQFPKDLEELTLSNNQINDLNMFKFPINLSALYLDGNQLERFLISSLDSLTLLDLNRNRIRRGNFLNLPKLTNLFLNFNEIYSLHEFAFPNSITNLSLNNNQINSFQWPRFPSNLKLLDLSNNQITSIEGIEFPVGLTSLYLHNNLLKDLTNYVYPPNLKILSLNDNQLINLGRIELLENLETLGWANNGRIKFTPEQLDFIKENELIDNEKKFTGDDVETFMSKFFKNKFTEDCLDLVANILNQYVYKVNQLTKDEGDNTKFFRSAVRSLTKEGNLVRELTAPNLRKEDFIFDSTLTEEFAPNSKFSLDIVHSAEGFLLYLALMLSVPHGAIVGKDDLIDMIRNDDELYYFYQKISEED